MDRFSLRLQEVFGEPIGNYAGDAPVGVPSEGAPCPDCGMMPIDGKCGCDHSSGSDEGAVCSGCGMMVVDGKCGCSHETAETCPHCGMLPIGGKCGCDAMTVSVEPSTSSCGCGGGMTQGTCQCGMNEAKKKGPTKKTAQKILRGTKTFKDKMDKVSSWADDPAAAAAWMMHKATGKWPSEK